ncbi:MAG: hypothetical protein EOP06_28235 [Proteobacteria bacterium]|nr:MAG: hypothetical protein EOP06_28235 [Pseudomonadota bacterium]
MKELTETEWADFYGPNFWPNTPDILPASLQRPDPTVYMQRLVLAATLSSNYGVYGPVYELMVSAPRAANSEEYLDSEKYELHQWDLRNPQSLAPFMKKINRLRSEHKALQDNKTLRFHDVNNDSLIAYSKSEGDEHIVVVVNLDATTVQSGVVELPLIEWGLSQTEAYPVHDLLTDTTYYWTGWRNFVELRPLQPAHIFKVSKI